MGVLDLNAARAARAAEAEAKGEEHILRFGDQEIHLPPEFNELPWRVAGPAMRGDVRAFLVELVGEETADKFFVEWDPTVADIAAFSDGLVELYGLNLPESPASDGSSTSSGNRSRLTSNGSTALTSGKPSTVLKPAASGASAP